MMVGYYKDPEHSAEAIDAEGWLHTGDMGKLDREGYLTITGRMKDVFKTAKGKYVAPVPIEGMLGQEPIIEQLCVIGYGMPQPVALVQLAESAMKGTRPGWRPSWRLPSTGSTTSWNPMPRLGHPGGQEPLEHRERGADPHHEDPPPPAGTKIRGHRRALVRQPAHPVGVLTGAGAAIWAHINDSRGSQWLPRCISGEASRQGGLGH